MYSFELILWKWNEFISSHFYRNAQRNEKFQIPLLLLKMKLNQDELRLFSRMRGVHKANCFIVIAFLWWMECIADFSALIVFKLISFNLLPTAVNLASMNPGQKCFNLKKLSVLNKCAQNVQEHEDLIYNFLL